MSEQHIVPLRTNLIIFAILQFLLVATVAAAYLPLGHFLHLPVAMSIAVIKAVLVILIFMHVRFSGRLTWVFSSAAFVWLVILFVIMLTDYQLPTRGWLGIYGK